MIVDCEKFDVNIMNLHRSMNISTWFPQIWYSVSNFAGGFFLSAMHTINPIFDGIVARTLWKWNASWLRCKVSSHSETGKLINLAICYMKRTSQFIWIIPINFITNITERLNKHSWGFRGILLIFQHTIQKHH